MHHGVVRIDNPDHVRGYYAGVVDALIPHLTGRAVTVGAADGSTLVVEQIDTADELDYLLDRGAVTLAMTLPAPSPTGTRPAATRCTLHVASGEGTGIATAATAALALCEALTADGLVAVVTTDGGEGLYVRGVGRGIRHSVREGHGRGIGTIRGRDDGPWEIAAGYAEDLARRAPEIATVDPRQADGRALIDASPSWPGNVTPVPYSLVARPAPGPGWGCVVPLDLDELAATTAGMPMDPGPQDVAARLATRGDLAAALLGLDDDPRVG